MFWRSRSSLYMLATLLAIYTTVQLLTMGYYFVNRTKQEMVWLRAFQGQSSLRDQAGGIQASLFPISMNETLLDESSGHHDIMEELLPGLHQKPSRELHKTWHSRHGKPRNLKLAPIPSKGEPWPYPQYRNVGGKEVCFDETVQIIVRPCTILVQAVERFRQAIIALLHEQTSDHGMKHTGHKTINYIVLNTKCGDTRPHPAMNESYSISVRGDIISVRAPEVWGMLHGLETLYQLIVPRRRKLLSSSSTLPSNDSSINSCMLLCLKEQSISDSPLYAYRGLLIDTARHYLPLDTMRSILDAMALNKLNVFHWHLVDDESFPLWLDSYPELAREGAFSSKHIYREEDVKDIVHYAALRGIRVMPELDSPGHARAWGYSHPDVILDCGINSQTKAGSFNPLLNETYTLLRGVFREIGKLFPDEYIHVGGDEVFKECWNFPSHQIVEGAFFKRFHEMLREELPTKTIIHWEEVIDVVGAKLRTDRDILECWLDPERHALAVDGGFRTIQARGWYLDHTDKDWAHSYDNKLYAGVMGGEACLWSEYIDENNIMNKAWPRACSVGERLWSHNVARSVEEHVQSRLQEHVCRMRRRGVAVSPVLGIFMCDTTHPYERAYDTNPSKTVYHKPRPARIRSFTNQTHQPDYRAMGGF